MRGSVYRDWFTRNNPMKNINHLLNILSLLWSTSSSTNSPIAKIITSEAAKHTDEIWYRRVNSRQLITDTRTFPLILKNSLIIDANEHHVDGIRIPRFKHVPWRNSSVENYLLFTTIPVEYLHPHLRIWHSLSIERLLTMEILLFSRLHSTPWDSGKVNSVHLAGIDR